MHKHAEVLRAIADGLPTQYRERPEGTWHTRQDDPRDKDPITYHFYDWRIKPAFEIPEGFTPWDGGLCPLPEDARFKLYFRTGIESDLCEYPPSKYLWDHNGSASDIVGYKVLPQKVVRWLWVYKTSTNLWRISTRFLTAQEAALFYRERKKLDFTEMEFDK